ncbi:hypothetical protein HDC93_002184 [Streptomyces sp. AK010]|nr:hypothetical protein [Streptomyces sp. AK010]
MGLRDFDPESSARRAFDGLRVTPYDQRWAVTGRFTPDDTGRTVRVPNADGRERGLGLGGEPVFALEGRELSLQVSLQGDGSLWAVFAGATSGSGSYRFRFLYPAAPDAEGRTTVTSTALLPPCAFADHFVCPFPPPGNTLDAEVAAGERTLA